MTDTRTREQVYDEEINPLMDHILRICRKHRIAMLADFHLPDDTQDTLHCTSKLFYLGTPQKMKDAFLALRPTREVMTAIVVTMEEK